MTDTRRFLKLRDVKTRSALSKSSIYAMVKVKEFPAPIKISKRASAWLEDEVELWVASRIERSRPSHGAN